MDPLPGHRRAIGPAVGGLQFADLAHVGPGERLQLVPEQSAFQQALGNPRAIDGDAGLGGAIFKTGPRIEHIAAHGVCERRTPVPRGET